MVRSYGILYYTQSNFNSSNTDGLVTMAHSNSFLSPYEILAIAQENAYLGIFFLFHYEIVCCVYSLESPHQGDSNEYTQPLLYRRSKILSKIIIIYIRTWRHD